MSHDLTPDEVEQDERELRQAERDMRSDGTWTGRLVRVAVEVAS